MANKINFIKRIFNQGSVKKTIIVVLIVSGVFSSWSGIRVTNAAWYGANWVYRKAIAVDYTQVPNTDQTNYPVLVCFNATGCPTANELKYTSSGGHVGKSDGSDIIFTAADGSTLLNYEIEKYVPTTGELAAWVKIGTLSHTANTSFYMYYGYAGYSGNAASNAQGTWDSSFNAVYHLPDGNSLSVNDSTLNTANSTNYGATAVAGQVDGSGNFNGSSYYISNPSTVLPSSSDFIVSLWFKTTSAGVIYSEQNAAIGSTPTSWEPMLYVDTAGYLRGGVYTGSTPTMVSSTTVNDGAWHQAAIVINKSGTSEALYLDGAQVGTWSGTPEGPFTTVTIGAGYSNYWTNPPSTTTSYFNGQIDEVRVTGNATARSADWLATEYNNQNLPSSFYSSIGTEETGASVPTTYQDGMIFYGVSGNTTPQMRAYDTTANAFDPASGTVAGAAPVIARMKASPAKNEYIAAYQDATGNLRVMCYDGANWSNEWSIAVAPSGTPTTRRFDIAYETTTGDVTVLYSRNTAATNALAYRTKSGASGCGAANWTAAVNMPTTTTLTTGTIQWVKAVRDGRDGSNLDAFIWAGSNSDLGAAIWSGSTFTNLKLLETNLERISVSQDVDSFDLAYESSSGDLMVVWGSGGSATVNGAYYNTCTGGASSCTWTAARTAIPSLANDATVLDLAADPTSDRMSFSSIGNGGSDLQAAYWNGGSWTGYNDIDASCETPLAGMRLTQTGWLTNNGITKWFLTYDDSTGTGISWFATTPGVALVKQSDWAATPSINDIRGRYELDENPYDSSEIMLTLSDSTNSVFAKRLNMNAAGTLTWSNADGGSSLGTKPSHPQQGFSFAYRRFKSITTISNFVTSDPGNMTTAPGFNGAVDSFGLVTSQSTDTITGLTINLTAGMWQYLQTVAIINDAEDVTYCSTTPTGDTVSLSGCTIPVSTTNTQFKIELTAASHASMPAPPGGLYTMAATVTGWTGTNVTHAGTDSGSGTFTIDNASPNNATALSGSAGNAANTLNWTTSDSADFNSNNGSIVYRWASAFAGSEVPAEGSTPVKGNTNGTATLACVVSAAASTALSRIDGTGGSADCTTTALTNGQAYTYKVFHRDIWGNYNVGVLIGTFTPREPIILAGYTNTAETALNYSAACTNCGARIGGGAAFRQTITITGTGLGTVAAGNRSTATNNIKIGTHQIADANITTWTSTSITFLTDSNVTGDTDADWGVNFGGVDGLTITVDGIVSTGLNFYVFSQVTSVTAPTAVANAAREYAVGDTDGVITLNGTRFGTAAAGGWVRIFGCDSTTCSSPSGSATTTSWNNMAITVQVPTVIADNVYTGSLIMQQGAGSSNKSHTYTTTGFRVLPRITSLNPSSGIIGDPVTTNGNHLCQNNGACPSAYDTNNRVTFTSAVNATSLTSWTSTAIATVVPTGTVTGNVFITSNTYTSNNLNFSGLSLVPNDPTAVNQFKDAALTQAISVGGISSSTPLYLTMTMQASVSGGTLYPQIEYKPIGSSFVCGVGACVTAMEGTGKSGPGPVDCAQTASGCAISITPTDNVYHWQARVRHNRGGSDYYSNWVSFGANGENATDFKLDSAGPVISFAGANACADAVTSLSTNSATVSWSTDESATGQIEYSKNSNLSSSALYPVPAGATAFSHSYGLNNLDSDTTYYFRVNSTDAYGNQTLRAASSPFCSFKTSNVTQPAKTVRFYVIGQQTALTGGLLATSSFAVYIPESSVAIKSTFLEINGISPVTGTNNIQVAVNNQSPLTYNIASASNFKLLYKVDPANLNLDPVDNLLSLTPSTNVNIISAKVFVTYSFEP